ncbi:MAG: Imm5 family immunity protein, partial [Acidimicrobiales bacterium]
MSDDLSPILRRALQEAEEDLAGSPHGELSLARRRRLWEELGAGMAGYGTLGHRRRSVLDLLTVEHVKPIWDAAYPGDGAVDEVIDAAREVLDGEQSVEWATRLQSRAWVAFLDRMSADQKFSAGDVGQAVCAALSTAAHDKP